MWVERVLQWLGYLPQKVSEGVYVSTDKTDSI